MDGDLAPCLLVAAPSLGCPFFNHTVVLLVDHREDGSLGFVVNRPAGMDFGEVLGQIGISVACAPDAAEPVLLGGPVAPQTGWVVFDLPDSAEAGSGTVRVSSGLAVSSSMDILDEIARGDGPDRHVMVLGYAGWGPGQLDKEIQEGSWIPVDVDLELIFDVPVEDRWAQALHALGVDPARVVSHTVAEA